MQISPFFNNKGQIWLPSLPNLVFKAHNLIFELIWRSMSMNHLQMSLTSFFCFSRVIKLLIWEDSNNSNLWWYWRISLQECVVWFGQYHDYCLRWNFWHCKQTHWLWLRFVPTVDNGETCRLLPTVTIRTLQLQVVQTWHAGICELLIWITPRLAIVPIGIWSPLGNEHYSPLAWSSDLVSV